MSQIHLKNKQTVISFIKALNKAIEEGKNIHDILKTHWAENVTLNVTSPFDEMNGIEESVNSFWIPLLSAFPDLENTPYILMSGEYKGTQCVTLTGNMVATFQQDWLDIPASNQPTWIRYATHFNLENDKITRAWYFIDMLDVMRQAGYQFFPGKGVEWVPPAPMTGDGIITYPIDEKESRFSLDLTNAMLDGLENYDGMSLDSMAQERFWDVQNMMWYGPSGIGTTRGLRGFQNNHQIPFLKAFPDRGITPKGLENHFAQIGDGNYSCDFGFPSMYGTHTGDGWLGLKATGKTVTPRVVDFWRREGDKLKENWVLIDMIHLLEQLGIDVFQKLKTQRNEQEAIYQ